ncbi:hypothetical protein [uncultured Roseibium sp.]|uniref:hypothetical protein n=1 Tax=uncultured Roseibium sp. TaxID=1936171 RepID=UPI0032169117
MINPQNNKNPLPNERDNRLEATKGARELISLLELCFQKLGDASSDQIADASIDLISNLILKVSNESQISKKKRLDLLETIQDIAAFEADKLSSRIPEKAPLLWRDREVRDENPYVFARRIYSDCIDIITKNDIGKLDKTLQNKLLEYDSKHGKPSTDIYIPTKGERNDPLVRSVSWSDILEASPEPIRKMLRAYKAQLNRGYRKRKSQREITAK